MLVKPLPTLEEFTYRYSIGRNNCIYAVKLMMEEQPRAQSNAIDHGIDMHKRIEEHIKGISHRLPHNIQVPVDNYNIKPENSEREFNFTDTDGFKVRSTVDALTDDGWIIDWKFPQTKQSGDFNMNSYALWQASLYMWVPRQLGIMIQGIKYLSWFKDTPGMAPEIKEIYWNEEQSEKDIRRHKNKASNIKDALSMNHFPASSSYDNCKFCSYRKTCQYSYIKK